MNLQAGWNDDRRFECKNRPLESIRPSPLAASFQNLITTRRTQSKFSLLENEEQQLYLKSAIDRAVVCAKSAPNHHKTEPFRFKRIMTPTDSSRHLADIASQVVYQKKLAKDPEHAQAHATRKRAKWQSIPAFLVTLVKDNQEAQILNHANEYEPMGYKPPTTERQLEDVSTLLSYSNDNLGAMYACTHHCIHAHIVRFGLCRSSKCLAKFTFRRRWDKVGHWPSNSYACLSDFGWRKRYGSRGGINHGRNGESSVVQKAKISQHCRGFTARHLIVNSILSDILFTVIPYNETEPHEMMAATATTVQDHHTTLLDEPEVVAPLSLTLVSSPLASSTSSNQLNIRIVIIAVAPG